MHQKIESIGAIEPIEKSAQSNQSKNQKIESIIFDFGNVLFDLDLPAIERNLRAAYGGNFEQARQKLLRDEVFTRYETGDLRSAEFVAAVAAAAEPPLAESTVVAAWNSIFLDMPRHRFELLLQLRQRYRVYLLSNINDLHERWIADYMVRTHGIHDYRADYFDGVYFSHHIRLRKPDAAVYAHVLADAVLDPAHTIFFDDLPENVAAGEAVGIRSVLHPVGTEIAETLRSVGLLG
jgi:putative hydrolase of the HAD superfamily